MIRVPEDFVIHDQQRLFWKGLRSCICTHYTCSGKFLKEEEEKMRTRTYARALFSTLLVVVALGAALQRSLRYKRHRHPHPLQWRRLHDRR